MHKRTKLSIAALAALGAFSGLTHAQSDDQTQASKLERVEVTGSHILSVNATSPSPMQVIDATQIAASGATNLADLLATSPVFGEPSLNRTNSNFLTTSAGQTTVNLRNLGDARTLVLVNGHRFVSGSPGSQAVDFNMIPTDFIEKIEVMTGGQSAAYGSDAVAGVVNIILKHDFQGVALNVKGGKSDKGDDSDMEASVTFGANLADNKGNIMAHFSASQQGAVYAKNHGVPTDMYDKALLDGKPSDLFTAQVPFYSSYSLLGKYTYYDANGNPLGVKSIDANGNPITPSTNGPAGDGVGATGFNRQAYRYLAVPVDRALMATKGNYQITDSSQLYFEGTFAHSRSVANIEPLPLASTTVFPDTGGLIPLTFNVNGTTVYNPYTPSWMQSAGATQYAFTRRMADMGPRTYELNNDTYRFVSGVKGDLTSTWSYDAYAGYGVTKQNQYGTGQVNIVNMMEALQVIPTANGPQCYNSTAAAQGCVPLNVFGQGAITPAAAAYISAPVTQDSRVTQRYAGATLSGEALQLPAGPLAVAFGYEWRSEASSTVWDQLTQLGLNGGNATPNTVGAYHVGEVFAEAHIPLLKNLPAVKSLDGTLAVRSSDYSTVGHTNSWNSGLDWAVNSSLRFRVSDSVSTRAPNISELYQGPEQTFPSGLVDPCSGIKAGDTSTLGKACLSDPGVAANVAQNGQFTLTQADLQGISGYVSGNPHLKAEQGNSIGLGTVITPKSIPVLDKFAFTLDYFYINIKHAINTIDPQYALNQCYAQGNPTYCSFITRFQTGSAANSIGALRYVNSGAANTGGERTRGLDFTMAYADRVGPGRLNADLAFTHLMTLYVVPTDGAALENTKGDVGAAANRASLDVGYQYNNWGVTGRLNYIGQSHLDQTWLAGYGFPFSSGNIGSVSYVNTQVTYKLGKAQFYGGVDNLFNRGYPLIPTGANANTTGTATAADVYDPIGRRYYIGLRYQF
ncbi:MAG: TonB-dependent receptor [Burkholderiales bacterium]|nr:TonB-dependent receptor [Burkholderiales bacterium]